MSELISVVVPVYNTGMILEECINSIIEQEITNIEIIIIDDGSDDKVTLELCNNLKLKDKRIRVIHQMNTGAAGARNRGIEESNGIYVCFVDSDDVVEKNILTKLYKLVETQSVRVSFCGMTIENNKKIVRPDAIKEEGKMTRNEFLHYFFLGNNHSSCAALYHKSVFEKHRFSLGETNEDYLLNFEVVFDEENVAVTPQKLYHYIKREGSVTTVETNIKNLHWLKHVKLIRDIMKKNNSEDLAQEIDYQYLHCNIVLCNKAILSMAKNQTEEAMIVYKTASQELKGKGKKISNNIYLSKRNKMIGKLISISPQFYRRTTIFIMKIRNKIQDIKIRTLGYKME